LGFDCSRNGIGRVSKGDKERVALGIDFMAVMLVERCTQKTSALGQHFAVALAQVLE
jgi:hypothetical protein